MKFVALVILVSAVVAFAAPSVAAAKSSTANQSNGWRWSLSDRTDYTDSILETVKYTYKWPNLYASCLLTVAQRSFRSLHAYLFASTALFNRWLHSKTVAHCITEYGDRIWQ